MKSYDVVIIGGGILGTSIAYWLSVLYDMRICLIEKEANVAMHTSSRNTGVVHSPFYLNPEKRRRLARASLLSHDMWETFAKRHGVAWRQTGTIELALEEGQHDTLEKYLKWGAQNGMSGDSLELLDSDRIREIEPHLRCHSGLYCRTDVSTDFGRLTLGLKKELDANGVHIMLGRRFAGAVRDDTIELDDGSTVSAGLVINCAGGDSLDVAQAFGLAQQYSDLHFRGEYWVANQDRAGLVNTNIYTVAEFSEFPFLDPHWIKRADGRTEIGPNAVPVMTPDTYEGYLSDPATTIAKLTEALTSGTRRLLTNPDFISLVSKEFLSSVSKTAMVERVRKFIPGISAGDFAERGTSGIRTPLISPEGSFVPDAVEVAADSSFHIINYNSPGATGAPAYSAFVVKKLSDTGLLGRPGHQRDSVWSFDDVTAQG